MRVLGILAALLPLAGPAAAAAVAAKGGGLRRLQACPAADMCTADGIAACPGDSYYLPGCLPNTCLCSPSGGGTATCTKVGCQAECATDSDCTASVRSRTAQPDLYPLCRCEARSAVPAIADAFDECLGEDPEGGRGCVSGRCGNAPCDGIAAVCSPGGRCVAVAAAEEEEEEKEEEYI